MFVACPVGQEIKQIEQSLLQEGDNMNDAKEAHWRAYRAFCTINHFDPRADFQTAISKFAAALIAQHRLESTVTVYMLHISEILATERSNYDKLLHALDIRIARRGHDHAMDLEVDDIAALIAKVYTDVSKPNALVMAFMWSTGLRCENLSEIFSRQVSIDASFLRVEVRLSKTASHPLDRAEVRIPVSWLPNMVIELSTALVEHARAARKKPDETVFGTPNVDFLNAHIRRGWKACGHRLQTMGAHKCPTSYTFRRSFVHMIVRRCTDPEGVTDWTKVIKFTLHRCEKTAKAYYAKHVSDLMS